MAFGWPAWVLLRRSVRGAMLQFLAEHLQPGGHVAFEVGEVRNGRALLRCDDQIEPSRSRSEASIELNSVINRDDGWGLIGPPLSSDALFCNISAFTSRSGGVGCLRLISLGAPQADGRPER